MTSASTTTSETQTRSVGETLRELLAARDDDAVVRFFEQLQETHLAQMRAAIEAARRGNTKNESVSRAQLDLLVKQLEEAQRAAENADAEAGAAEQSPGAQADAKLKSAAAIAKKPDEEKPKKPPPRRRPLPPDLLRVDNLIRVPDDQRPCPRCGRERQTCGHEVTEILDIVPMQVVVRKDMREKVACTNSECDGAITCAPLGDKVIEGGAYSARLVADLLVSKFEDGLPLYRQHERYERHGFDMPLASMGDQIAWAADLLAPIARVLTDEVLHADVMHADATSMPVLDKDSPKGIKLGSMWGYVGVNIHVLDGKAIQDLRAAYIYNTTAKAKGQRAGEHGPVEMLERRRKTRKPYVCVDAAGVFDASFKIAGLLEIACNMHGRRYFKKALDAEDKRAALPLQAYKKLYLIEEKVRGKPPDEVQAVREVESRPVFDELLAWCRTYKETEPPKSLLGKAVGYFVRNAVALGRFLDDGTLPIDNGVVERLHREVAVGRRNYLFCGSDVGAERAAIAYTVLGTCKLLGINPLDYLADVLPLLARGISIARDLPALMPAAWKAARAAAA